MIRSLIFAAAALHCGAVLAGQCTYTVENVAYKNLVAKLYLPAGPRSPAVIAFGGSEGGSSTGDSTGEMLAPHCVAVLGLAYFKAPGLPQSLDHIPLDYFIDALDYLSRQPGVDPARIGVVAGSRGSEAALLMASMDARIKSVVVTTPSNFAWYGRTTEASAWTWRGEDIPALSLKGDAALPQVQRFNATLDGVTPLHRGAIHIEKINGPIFFISAARDEIWPSTRMSNDMVKYLKDHEFKYPVRHDVYPAGHGFSKEYATAIRQSVVAHFLNTL